MSRRENIGVPAGSMELEVDGVRLAVAREGHGPALVCLHAIGHGGGDFDAFASAVKNRYEVIRIDWPSQGRSGPTRSRSRPRAMLNSCMCRGKVAHRAADHHRKFDRRRGRNHLCE